MLSRLGARKQNVATAADWMESARPGVEAVDKHRTS
jgi:hypothetical protein